MYFLGHVCHLTMEFPPRCFEGYPRIPVEVKIDCCLHNNQTVLFRFPCGRMWFQFPSNAFWKKFQSHQPPTFLLSTHKGNLAWTTNFRQCLKCIFFFNSSLSLSRWTGSRASTDTEQRISNVVQTFTKFPRVPRNSNVQTLDGEVLILRVSFTSYSSQNRPFSQWETPSGPKKITRRGE